VVLACLALGALLLVLRAMGSEIGWAFQLQEPGVVVALLVLAVAITANLAGLYELPSLSITRAGGRASAFSTGLLAAFVATPCTGPFMAAALGAALLLPWWQGMVLFGALGLGLALPFLLLGYVPALRRMLPKPGAWMETFRRVLAVPMGLVALALLWLAWRLGGTNFASAAGLLGAILVLALWAIGREQRAGRDAMKIAAIGGLVLAGLAFVAVPRAYEPRSPEADASLLAAVPFSEAALAEARAANRPVFLWFTADWCLTCKVNESVAIEREATRAAFDRAGVVAMRGDWTRRDPEITRFLTAHGVAGVPLYLWYAPGAQGEVLPQVLGPDSLVELAEGSRQ
jgi:thiol:disulfide interchange protein